MRTIPAYRTISHGRLLIEYTPTDEQFVQETAGTLEEALDFLCDYFGLPTPLTGVRVILTPDRPEFDRCVRDILKVEIEVPSNPWRIAQPQRRDLVVLSPRVWEKEYN